ncbi:MAG: hypothetical protein EAZ30_15680 [Betaproteobacteria bacterium]|nr:MAG: hypothetical protein EAZ30_15680 [Betaproteobacteria bacterium]
MWESSGLNRQTYSLKPRFIDADCADFTGGRRLARCQSSDGVSHTEIEQTPLSSDFVTVSLHPIT